MGCAEMSCAEVITSWLQGSNEVVGGIPLRWSSSLSPSFALSGLEMEPRKIRHRRVLRGCFIRASPLLSEVEEGREEGRGPWRAFSLRAASFSRALGPVRSRKDCLREEVRREGGETNEREKVDLIRFNKLKQNQVEK